MFLLRFLHGAFGELPTSDVLSTSDVLLTSDVPTSDVPTSDMLPTSEVTAASIFCPDVPPCRRSRLALLSNDSSWHRCQSLNNISISEIPLDWVPRCIRHKLRPRHSLLELPTKAEPDPEPDQALYVGATC